MAMDVDAYELLKVEKRSGPRILLPDTVQTDVRTAGAHRE